MFSSRNCPLLIVTIASLVTFTALSFAFPKNCYELQKLGQQKSGTYTIYPSGNQGTQAYCDMLTDGGGWTIIQRRGTKIEEDEPREDFYRRWAEYERGFGSSTKDHWIGLANLHALTEAQDQELRIELSRWCDGDTEYEAANYGKFIVSDASTNFTLTISNFTGNIGDAMPAQNYKFTTRDRDNDVYETGNCAEIYRGARWYGACHSANLNGEYLSGPAPYGMGIQWQQYTGYDYSLKRVEMKIRTKSAIKNGIIACA